MTVHYLYLRTNIKSSFQGYKKVALSNSSNFMYKVEKNLFVYIVY